MFLTRIEKRILNALKSSPAYESWETICNEFSEDKACSALKALEEKNFLTCTYAGNKPWFVKLNFKGYFYNEIIINEIKEFFLKSIVTPVIVSFITALIASRIF